MNKHRLFEKRTQRDSAPTEIQNEEVKEVPLMACTQWAEKVNAAFPGGFSPEERAAFEIHTASCEACASILTDYEAMGALLQTFPIPEPPDGLPPQLLQLWEEESHDNKTMSSDGQAVSQYATVFPYREGRSSKEMEDIDNVVDQKTALPMNFYKSIRIPDGRSRRRDNLLAS